MSDLTPFDKLKLEKLYEMKDGCVLDFTNKTFSDFILDSVEIDIYEEKFNYYTTSKANRLRRFWEIESNFIVAKLTTDMAQYWKSQKLIKNLEITKNEDSLYTECIKIADRLKNEKQILNQNVITGEFDDKEISRLLNDIQNNIKIDQPQLVLDRLHTYLVSYFRNLCKKHDIEYFQNDTINNLCGKYKKHLEANSLIETEMSKRIIGSIISLLESFNSIRNDKSFAHDNEILSYAESVFVIENVLSILKFIESIEKKLIKFG